MGPCCHSEVSSRDGWDSAPNLRMCEFGERGPERHLAGDRGPCPGTGAPSCPWPLLWTGALTGHCCALPALPLHSQPCVDKNPVSLKSQHAWSHPPRGTRRLLQPRQGFSSFLFSPCSSCCNDEQQAPRRRLERLPRDTADCWSLPGRGRPVVHLCLGVSASGDVNGAPRPPRAVPAPAATSAVVCRHRMVAPHALIVVCGGGRSRSSQPGSRGKKGAGLSCLTSRVEIATLLLTT